MKQVSKEKLEELEGKLVYLNTMIIKSQHRYNKLAKKVRKLRENVQL